MANKGKDPNKPFSVIDTYTGETKSYNSMAEWLASENGNATSKIQKKANAIVREAAPKPMPPTTFNAESYSKLTNAASFNAGEGAMATKEAGKISESKALNDAISKRETGLTGNTWFDAGYAMGKARKANVEAAGSVKAANTQRKQRVDEAVMRGVGRVKSAFGLDRKKPIREGEYKSVRQAVKDVKNNVTKTHKIADKFGHENKYGGKNATKKQAKKWDKFIHNETYQRYDAARKTLNRGN